MDIETPEDIIRRYKIEFSLHVRSNEKGKRAVCVKDGLCNLPAIVNNYEERYIYATFSKKELIDGLRCSDIKIIYNASEVCYQIYLNDGLYYNADICKFKVQGDRKIYYIVVDKLGRHNYCTLH